MRVSITLALVAALAAASAQAGVVRRNAFPQSLHGTWASTAEACGKSDDDAKVVISAKQYVRAKANCNLVWLTVTAAPNGANYSAELRCVDQGSGKASPPLAVLFRPTDSDPMSVRSSTDKPTAFQRCP